MRRARHRVRDPAGEGDEREDVVPVVLEHARQLVGPLPAQVLEVHRGDQRARQVVVPEKAQHVLLDGSEAAVDQSRAPEPPGGAEQVHVEDLAGKPSPAEHEARLEQRQVEAGPVVRDEAVELPERLLEHGEQRGLLVEIAHEELAHLELVAVEEADADQERVGAGAAREPGGLGVEVEQAAPVGDRLAAAAQQGQRGRRGVARGQQRLRAVPVAHREPAADHQELAPLVLLDGAVERASRAIEESPRPDARGSSPRYGG